MVILHITNIKNELTSGVDVAVSQHIKAQSEIAQVAVININNTTISTADKQFRYYSNFDLNELTSPFSTPDIVLFHGIYCLEFVKIAKKLNRRSIPYIIIPHGGLSSTAQSKKILKKTVANFLLFNNFFKKARAIQFLSAHEMDSSKYRNKGFIGTNGINIPVAKKCIGSCDNIRMVYIGRFEVHIKGLDLMLDAVRNARDLFRSNRIHLDLYGPDKQDGHKAVNALIAKYDVADYVTVHGAVTGNDKERVLLDTDLFIQTSRTEGMPMGILETLSYGVPCILTEGTGFSQIFNEYPAGWISKNDGIEISRAIEQAVAERNTWESKSDMAKRLIFENYVWEKVANETIAEYEKMVKWG